MARFTCFFSKLLIGKKKRSKVPIEVSDSKKGEANGSLHVNHIDPPNPIVDKIVINESFSDPSTLKPELTSNKNLAQMDLAVDPAYEGGDERDETLSLKRDYSDFDLQAQADPNYSNLGFTEPFKNKLEGDEDTITPELAIQSGHVSDPGMCRTTALWGSPVLNRSCSNIETKRRQPINSPTKSHSYNDLKNLSGDGNPYFGVQNSPFSAKSNCSADRVMLKKRSSSQVLPSRSRKLWWKLFLWSHRNIHKPLGISVPPVSAMTSNQKAGYSSDTLETFPEDRKKKGVKEPGNQWVAFAVDSSSPFDRINAWVNSIEETRFSPIDDDEDDEDDEEEEQQIMEEKVILLHHTSEIGESSGKKTPSYYGGRRTMEETVQANNVIQSLSSLSSVAHISGMGLKVIPSISAFSSLRSVNLSGNFIVQINPGSLPRGLHTLDLSRNKIASIEGLRELTRLRILNLSYNRISRIGHGLSNCTLIKELYLAGNKISDVEGLHRLVKLTVLDLSFNKITTAKALGQLVANYNSLLAINLIGNPVQSNIGDDHLRKAVTSLLPHLTYLNKQTIKPQRAREAVTDSVAKAALGSGSSGSGRRRMTKRATQSSGLASSLFGGYQKGSQHISKRRHHHNHQHSSSTSRK